MKLTFIKNKQNYFFILPMLGGLIARISVFLMKDSLWYDECLFLRALFYRSFSELFLPFVGGEVVQPWGFLFVVKSLLFFGNAHEYNYIISSLLFSFLSLYIFNKAARKSLGLWPSWLATFVFAFSYYIVQYAAECKPYALDLLLSVGFYYMALRARDFIFRWSNVFWVSLLGAVAVWFSFISPLLLFVYGIVLLYTKFKQKSYEECKSLVIATFTWYLSFIFFKTLFIDKALAGNSYLYQYWYDFKAFPYQSITQLDFLLWPMHSMVRFFKAPFPLASGIGLLFFILGCWHFLRKERYSAALLIGPFVLALLLACFNLYPFAGRTVLYLIPMATILCVKGASVFAGKNFYLNFLLNIFFIGVFINANVAEFRERPVMNIDGSRAAVEYIFDSYNPGDLVLLGRYSHPQFNFYSTNFDINVEMISYHHPWTDTDNIPSWFTEPRTGHTYLEDLQRNIDGVDRVWLFITNNSYNEMELVFRYLETRGKVKLVYNRHNANVLLFEPWLENL